MIGWDGCAVVLIGTSVDFTFVGIVVVDSTGILVGPKVGSKNIGVKDGCTTCGDEEGALVGPNVDKVGAWVGPKLGACPRTESRKYEKTK